MGDLLGDRAYLRLLGRRREVIEEVLELERLDGGLLFLEGPPQAAFLRLRARRFEGKGARSDRQHRAHPRQLRLAARAAEDHDADRDEDDPCRGGDRELQAADGPRLDFFERVV
ncbi:MAG: hypothetical protein HY554_15740 [Elusimicrobia bacterium]|nr:hypothetical protein [Elusimicrobiota bacterium]